VKGNKTRGRGYSVVEERDALISKALSWVLKRTVTEDEEQEEGEEKLVADAEGWVDCEEVVSAAKPLVLRKRLTNCSYNAPTSPPSKSHSPKSKLS